MTGPVRVLASLGSRARKTLTAAVAAVLVLGAVSTSVPTEAAWTDSTRFAAPASAGTWQTQTPANSVIVPNSPTTSITSTNWEISTGDGGAAFCVVLVVTGKSAQPTAWELRADLRKAPFNGIALDRVKSQGDPVTLRAAPGDPSTLLITGDSTNRVLDSSRTVRVRLCVWDAPIPPVGDPSWYTTSVAQGEWTTSKACKVLTVKGRVTDLDANPFFFTWVAQLDLTDAKRHVLSSGGVLNWLEFAPWPSDGYQFRLNPAATDPIADRYTVTGGRMTSIRGTQQVTVTACVHGK